MTDPALNLTVPRHAAVEAVDALLQRIQHAIDENDWEEAAAHAGALAAFTKALDQQQRSYAGGWK